MSLFGPAGSRETTVDEAWLHDGNLVLKFAGVDSISDAEAIRGFDVAVPEGSRAELGEGEFYLSDLVGCALLTRGDGREIGIVDGWRETPGGVLLESGSLLIPFAKAICTEIDIAGKRIVVDLPEGLENLNSS